MNWKLTIWQAIVLVLSLMFWGYGSRLSADVISGRSFDGMAVFYFVLLLTLVTMGIALFQRRVWALTLSGTVGLTYLFQFGFTRLNLLGTGIFLLLGLYSSINSGAEIGQRTKINMRRIIQHGSLPVILGLFILISFAAYQSSFAEELGKSERLPSASQNFIRSVVEQTVGRQIKTDNETEKQNIISQITDETFGEINTFLKPYFQFAPPLLAFGLFLVLWGISWLFVWLSALLGMLIFWILKRFNFIVIEERDTKAEILVV
ncbi:MAG: hypothetical protein HYT64_02065 [Candidatus Yanofskybacteria bacterium]|nr:hypothetical protein [Candidatus Yanofskybacteria bacterium]